MSDQADVDAVVALAARCEDRAREAAEYATDCRLGGRGSQEWIAEAANYAAIAKFLRARSQGDTSNE